MTTWIIFKYIYILRPSVVVNFNCEKVTNRGKWSTILICDDFTVKAFYVGLCYIGVGRWPGRLSNLSSKLISRSPSQVNTAPLMGKKKHSSKWWSKYFVKQNVRSDKLKSKYHVCISSIITNFDFTYVTSKTDHSLKSVWWEDGRLKDWVICLYSQSDWI